PAGGDSDHAYREASLEVEQEIARAEPPLEPDGPVPGRRIRPRRSSTGRVGAALRGETAAREAGGDPEGREVLDQRERRESPGGNGPVVGIDSEGGCGVQRRHP